VRSLRTIFYCSGGGEFPHEFPAQNRQCSGREHTYGGGALFSLSLMDYRLLFAEIASDLVAARDPL
jgi:hypothetical protein